MKFKTLGIVAFLFVLCFAFSPFVKADNEKKLGVINSPKYGSTFYRGESINYNAQVTNFNSKAGYPWVLITKENSPEEDYKQFMLTVPGETQTLAGTFATKSIKPGRYYLVVYMNFFDGNPDVEGNYISTKIFIRDLARPTNVKAVGKKKKIKISYKAVTGATKYNIYRSKKKSKGYKLIATTTKTSYKDKKAKRGKLYYYKIQSVRDVNGSITSSYSKKVKAYRR